MFWYDNDIKDAERRRDEYAGPTPIVFYGSSSIRLWSSLKRDLEPWPVLNLGFGGSTMAACCWFANKLVLSTKAQALVLYAGDNDLGDGRHPEEVINQFRLLVNDWYAHTAGKPMFFISIKQSPSRAHLSKSIRYSNEQIHSICEESGECHFIDIASAMKSGDRDPNPALFLDDGLHMNADGYATWTPIVREAITNVLSPPG